MVSDPSFHWPTSIIMLDPKSNVGNKGPIILWYGALHLMKTHTLKTLRKKKKKNKTSGKQIECIEPKMKTCLDFPKRDQKTLLELRIKPENSSCMAEIAVRCCESIHGVCNRSERNGVRCIVGLKGITEGLDRRWLEMRNG